MTSLFQMGNRALVQSVTMLLILLSSFLGRIIFAQAAVTLISFNAMPDMANKNIGLLWETGSELDFTGFYILRSSSPDVDFTPLEDQDGDPVFFPAQGEGDAGAQYYFHDIDVDMGMLYYYKLGMIDLGGASSFSDVASAFLGCW